MAAMLLSMLVLGACGGEEARPTPDYSSVLTPLERGQATVTPPFQAATNITITPGPSPTSPPDTARPSPTLSLPPATPVIKPTPTSLTEDVLTSDDLGIGVWTDTDVLWSPTGDVFVLHVAREGTDSDFFYLVRPPDSVQNSLRLPGSVFGSMAWSPDGRYLSYIEKDNTGGVGPVRLVDMNRGATDRKLFSGPCTAATWLATGKLLATCGLAVYLFEDELEAGAKSDGPQVLYKLENNRFPGSQVELSLLFQALPSPNGQQVAIYGLRKQSGPLPVGEIAFFNVATKKINLLERNNRPVTMTDWTPDSKYLILRNLTGDQAVVYTFDFYLADPLSFKITQNLTKSNDKCDPVLGAKPDCQGQNPSTSQSYRVLFSPEGDRYFFSSLRYVSKPGQPLTTIERLSSTKIGGKAEQLVETGAGERIISLEWLPNGHYFYSVGGGTAPAKAVLDGKTLEVKSKAGPLPATTPKGSPAATTPLTRAGAGALSGLLQATTAPAQTTAAPATTQPPAAPSTAPATTAPALTTPALTTAPPDPTTPPGPTEPPATAPPATPSLTAAPQGTSLLGFDTATAKARTTQAQVVVTRAPSDTTTTPTPLANVYPRPNAYYLSPSGNWLLSVERVAASDKVVQFQVRLLPFSLK